MGIPFFVKFDFGANWKDSKYYCCRGCFKDSGHLAPPSDSNRMTHIACRDEIFFPSLDGVDGKVSHLFNTIENVTVGETRDRAFGYLRYDAAEVYCKRCLRSLGWKVIKVKPRSQAIREGRYLLDLTKIDQWTGQKVDVQWSVDGHTWISP